MIIYLSRIDLPNKHYQRSITHISDFSHVVLVISRDLLQHTARSQVYIFSPHQVTLAQRAFTILIGVYFQVTLLSFEVFAFLLQLGQKLTIHLHVCFAFIFWILCFFHKLLIDIVLDVKLRGSSADSMFVGGCRTIVGGALEKR